jgi:hypothetical protein
MVPQFLTDQWQSLIGHNDDSPWRGRFGGVRVKVTEAFRGAGSTTRPDVDYDLAVTPMDPGAVRQCSCD